MARRVLPEPDDAQRDALAHVQACVEARRAAEYAAVDAVCRAAELGLTATQIAPFAGVSRQSVDSMLARHRPA